MNTVDFTQLHTDNTNYFTEDKLDKYMFKKGKSITDPYKNTTTTYYTNPRHVTVAKSGFGMQIMFNPTRYLQGYNLKQNTRRQNIETFEKIEDDLEFRVSDFSLTRFDWNADIFMDHSVSDYMPIFRKTRQYPKTDEYEESITYSNQSNKFVIYDKVAEWKAKGHPIADMDGEQMRFELSVKKINTKLIKDIKTVKQLHQKDNYINVIHEWKGRYDRLPKQSITTSNNFTMPNDLDIFDQQALCLINSIGLDNYLIKLQQDFKAKRMGRDKKTNAERKALELHNVYIIGSKKDEDKLHEMNRKIEDKYQQCIQKA